MPNPPTFVLARELATCARQGLSGTVGGEPDRVCLIVPGMIADDGCDCGQLAVTVDRMFPSRVFPAEATGDNDQPPCGVPWLAAVILVSIMRCAPGPDSAGRPPSCAQLDQAALVWHEDAAAVRAAVGCCLADMYRLDRIGGFVVGDTVARGPAGGCVGSELRVTVAVPHCLCPDPAGS